MKSFKYLLLTLTIILGQISGAYARECNHLEIGKARAEQQAWTEQIRGASDDFRDARQAEERAVGGIWKRFISAITFPVDNLKDLLTGENEAKLGEEVNKWVDAGMTKYHASEDYNVVQTQMTNFRTNERATLQFISECAKELQEAQSEGLGETEEDVRHDEDITGCDDFVTLRCNDGPEEDPNEGTDITITDEDALISLITLCNETPGFHWENGQCVPD